MAFSDDLLKILTNYSGGYKLMRQKLLSTYDYADNKRNISNFKDQTLRTTLWRLRRNGLIKNEKGIWKITQNGKTYLNKKIHSRAPRFGHLKVKSREKDLIVIFDIPEYKKKQRNWLRLNLINLGFMQLQKSVWVGPSPLPEEFIKYLNDNNILCYLKFFQVKEKDII